MLREVETYTLQGAAIRPRRQYGPWHSANDNPCVTRELAITRYRLIWGKCGTVSRGYLVTVQNRKGFSPQYLQIMHRVVLWKLSRLLILKERVKHELYHRWLKIE
jgi:hypothetical protein